MNATRTTKSPYQLLPGEFCQMEFDEGKVYFARCPSGLLANLSRHAITEHDDGSITVAPSILVRDGDSEWHGFLERGTWRQC